MEGPGLARTEFSAFPYPPYAIQQQFMQQLYCTVEQGNVGLFESPTGTGKTLSVICSVLQWLLDTQELLKQQELERAKQQQEQQQQEQQQQASQGEGGELPAWLLNYQAPPSPGPAAPATAQGLQQQQQVAMQPSQAAAKGPHVAAVPASTPSAAVGTNTAAGAAAGLDPEMMEYLIKDGSGANPCGASTKRSRIAAWDTSSDSDSSSEQPPAATSAPGAPAPRRRTCPQVIFCSRTHSQLSQFVSELHRTCLAEALTLVAVASRKALCINPQVSRLQHLGQINEACLDLQRRKPASSRKAAATTASTAPAAAGPRASSTGDEAGRSSKGLQQLAAGRPRRSKAGGSKAAGGGGCPYLRPGRGEAAWEEFQDLVLALPIDVEELGRMGQQKQVCPYYGSRRAVPEADVVLAPYSAVLQREARDSLGISLEGAVVVFDEAHNLLDAVNASHSAAITGAQLLACQAAIQGYLQRFSGVLAAANAQQLQLVLKVVAALLRGLEPHSAQQQQQQQQQQHQDQPGSAASQRQPGAALPGRGGAGTPGAAGMVGRVCRVNDVLLDLGLDNVNLFPLLTWMREAKMVFKMAGYASCVAAASGTVHPGPTQQRTSQAQAMNTAATSAGAGASSTRGLPPQASHTQQLPPAAPGGSVTAALHALVSFMTALTNWDADGRIIIEPAASKPLAASRHHQQQRQQQQQEVVGARPAATAAGHVGDDEADLPLAAADDLDALGASAAGGARASSAQPGAGPGAGSGGGSQPPRSGRYSFVLLNAARHFQEVLAAARSVVLVSGTLAPIHSLRAQLLPSVAPERVTHFECGHVIAPDQLLALSIGTGPSGRPLDLRHSNRGKVELMDDAGAVLLNLAGVVPGGMVVFVGSFAYLEQLWGRWEHTGLLQRLGKKKTVFREPRTAQEVETVLAEYSAAIRGAASNTATNATAAAAATTSSSTRQAAQGTPLPPASGTGPGAAEHVGSSSQAPDAGAGGSDQSLGSPRGAAGGALLLCVVGGKLSEGINFGDDLGRAVVVLGLPYPNPADPELRERMAYLDAQAAATKAAAAASQPAVPTTAETVAAAAAAAAADKAAAAHVPPTAAAGAGRPGVGCTGGTAAPSVVALTGREYYEGLCFKAVNQCIGRVIRHKGDYAVVILVDTRWVTPSVCAAGPSTTGAASAGGNRAGGRGGGGGGLYSTGPISKLPGWIQRSYAGGTGEFGEGFKSVAEFFRAKRQQQA